MKYEVCGQCGRVLTHKHKYMLLKDEEDRYRDYHSIRVDLCEICFEDIMKKRACVFESLRENSGPTVNNNCGCGNGGNNQPETTPDCDCEDKFIVEF